MSEGNYFTVNPQEMKFLIDSIRGANIPAAAARVIVGIEDKLIAEAKRIQDKAEAGEIADGETVEYALLLDEQESNIVAQIVNGGNVRGAQARIVLGLQDKLNPVIEAQQQAAVAQ